MALIHDILLKYWAYSKFRPLQEEIIQSVLDGKDTLALMPTGGGKSICYQVPALALNGTCIVISPLIALMKDQVDGLKRKGISAAAIFSGMSFREIDITLENAMQGQYKLLYVSPERLSTEIFKTRISQMEVSFIAVDEAHCISQWGYDFRPAYLKIAEIRELLPNITVLALTATATPEVAGDIMEKLVFNEGQKFVKSFVRKNLAYVVNREDDKQKKLIDILHKVPGTAVVYARNRRRTQELAFLLSKNEISADFYHAGLDGAERDKRQEAWMTGRTRVIVCTNAFGMGIDKPDVRLVVHMDIPDNIEAYYQEAGRAGRDERKAYAVLLYNDIDKQESEQRLQESLPSIQDIQQCYGFLGQYFQLAIGSGEFAAFNFDMQDFCKRFGLSPLKTLNCLKTLSDEEWLTLSDAIAQPSRVHIMAGQEAIYKLQVDTPQYEPFMKLLLRSYSGLFDQYVPINENMIANKLRSKVPDVIKAFEILKKNGYIDYVPASSLPQITFLKPRLKEKDLALQVRKIEQRRKLRFKQLESMWLYAGSGSTCRTVLLTAYFGEKNVAPCGICDVCQRRKKLGLSDSKYDDISRSILEQLRFEPMHIQYLCDRLKSIPEEQLLQSIEWLIECGELIQNEQFKLELHKK